MSENQKPMKKIVTAYVDDFGGLSYYFDGKTIDEVIQALVEIKSKYEGRDLFFDYEYLDNTCDIMERREETDAELNSRLAREGLEEANRQFILKQEEFRDRQEYERLCKKFGIP